MNFKEQLIESLNENTLNGIIEIFKKLCGEDIKIEERDKNLLKEIIRPAEKQKEIDYEQFNEILLLLNQKRVSKCFFDFFFEPEENKISLKNIKKGLVKFRGYAMLCFGNFRFAYKNLIEKEKEEDFKESLKPYCEESREIKSIFRNRAEKAIDINKIDKDKIWYIGYLPIGLYHNDSLRLIALRYKNNDIKLDDKEIINLLRVIKKKPEDIKKIADSISREEIEKFRPKLNDLTDELDNIKNCIKEAIKTARDNTNIYLTWDYMDLYFATSMREKWEYEFTFNFIEKLFKNSKLNSLNLRYFDPTQSFYENRIDKGLIEGLMLKRAECTIYLSQEADTLGKDSELAATLAQGKPVIAYVPQIKNSDYDNYINEIKKYPLDFFWKRLLLLRAEEIFNESEFLDELKSEFGRDFFQIEESFFKKISDWNYTRNFHLVSLEEYEFKEREKEILDYICKILVIAEKHYFNRRAKLLKHVHPLAIQVNLKSGVANGVLVVRSINDCADLLNNILTNSMNFKIKHKEGITILEEEISKCPYRVVTDNIKLTNSFWNFYL